MVEQLPKSGSKKRKSMAKVGRHIGVLAGLYNTWRLEHGQAVSRLSLSSSLCSG